MSDTPRTDAAWSSGFDPVVVSAAELARRLRERCAELERENAELRKDKKRLDWLTTQNRVDYSISYWRKTDTKTLRAALDAARAKEGQL